MLPLNPEGRKVADAWDAAKDRAAGNECRSCGAAGIMRIPGRLYVHWVDDNTLQMDTDTGTQTRLFGLEVRHPPPGSATVAGKLGSVRGSAWP